MTKEKKKIWIAFQSKEFKKRFQNNKLYNFKEKFKKEIIF